MQSKLKLKCYYNALDNHVHTNIRNIKFVEEGGSIKRRFSGIAKTAAILFFTIAVGVLAIGAIIRYITQWMGYEPQESLGVVSDTMGLLSFLVSISFVVLHQITDQRTAPPFGIESFSQVVPGQMDDAPILFREPTPHLADFRVGYVIPPKTAMIEIAEKLHVRIPQLVGSESKYEDFQPNRQASYVLVQGASGSGKTIAGLHIGYELFLENWAVYHIDIPDVLKHRSGERIVDWIAAHSGNVLLLIDNVHVDPGTAVALARSFDLISENENLKPKLRIMFLGRSAESYSHEKYEGPMGELLQCCSQSIVEIVPDMDVVKGLMKLVNAQKSGLNLNAPKKLIEDSGGDIAVLCEMLRCQLDIEDELRCDLKGLPEYAMTRRLMDLKPSKHKAGTHIIGLVSTFSLIEYSLSYENIIQWCERNGGLPHYRETLNALLASGHFQTQINPKTKDMLISVPHQSLARLLLDASREVLGKITPSCRDVHRIEYSILMNHIDFPPRNLILFSIKLAHHAEDSNDIDLSIALWDKLKNHPKLKAPIDAALYLVGLQFLKSEYFDTAEEVFLKASEIGPESFPVWDGLGRVFGAVGKAEEAEAAFRKSISLNDEFQFGWEGLGRALLHKEDYVEAEKVFRKALEIDSEYHCAFFGLGRSLSKQERYSEAIEAFRNAIVYFENDGQSWGRLGYCLFMEEEYDEALLAYTNAVEIDENSGGDWCGRGATLEKLERIDEAEAAYQKAIEVAAPQCFSWIAIGEFLARQTRFKEAERYLEQASEICADVVRYWNVLGEVYNHLRKWEKSADAYRNGISIDEKDHNLWRDLAESLMNQGNLEEAEAAARRAIDCPTDCICVWLMLGQILIRKREMEKALEAIQIAIRKEPNDDQALALQGYALILTGRHEEAIAVLKKVLRTNPSSVQALYNIACCYSLVNRSEEALSYLRKAIQIDPKIKRLAASDSDFKHLLDNLDFKSLINEE
ncbi:MAG: tetratricopeptide repeat protein [Candidatus Thorarchaeota archaeon]